VPARVAGHGYIDRVLARDRALEGDPEIFDDKVKPLGPLNDLGLLQFPDLAGQ
jgi:hypothetical protein